MQIRLQLKQEIKKKQHANSLHVVFSLSLVKHKMTRAAEKLI
jgi:hypothetical protein